MTSPRTRSLLAALLFLGQLSGVLHVLGHVDERGCAQASHPAHVAHAAMSEDVHVHADAHAVGCTPVPDPGGETGRHDGALCGLCLVSAGGIGPADTARAPMALSRAGLEVLSRPAAPSPPTRRTLAHPARAPPTILS